jgi:hypothetical protein
MLSSFYCHLYHALYGDIGEYRSVLCTEWIIIGVAFALILHLGHVL